MDADMLLYWDAFNELVSNEDILKYSSNPLNIYEAEIMDGPIIDIGCGQSSILLSYSRTDRELYAIDSEPLQLANLKNRMVELNGRVKDQWYFIELTFPEQDIPDKIYSVVAFINLLHFFDIPRAKDAIAKIKSKTATGSLIYIIVHSVKHYTNDPTNPENNNYFSHFYSLQDLDSVFEEKTFERIYASDVERKPSKQDELVSDRWIDKYLDKLGITDERERDQVKEDNKENKAENYLEVVYRRL